MVLDGCRQSPPTQSHGYDQRSGRRRRPLTAITYHLAGDSPGGPGQAVHPALPVRGRGSRVYQTLAVRKPGPGSEAVDLSERVEYYRSAVLQALPCHDCLPLSLMTLTVKPLC